MHKLPLRRKSALVLTICSALLAIAAAPAIAGGEVEDPPVVEISLQGAAAISPGVSPGIQDSLVIVPAVTPTGRRTAAGYRLEVSAADGTVVRTFAEENPRPEAVFGRISSGRRDRAVAIPETIEWDGSNDAGETVADGIYRVRLTGTDHRGAAAATESLAVVVDTIPPVVEVTLPYLIFSPNSDGNKDFLIVEQSGSLEEEWVGTFTTADGTEVDEITWTGRPENFSWTGLVDDGEPLVDGGYGYQVSATDAAGNSGSEQIVGIFVDTRDTPISITLDQAAFSPNGDSSQDTLSFLPEVPVNTGVVSWEIRVIGADGTVEWQTSGTGTVPGSVLFDGVVAGGSRIREGEYQGSIAVLYDNGNNPQAETLPFNVDITPPAARVTLDPPIVSPNGDGSQDVLTIRTETSVENEWLARIVAIDGTVVREVRWRGTPDEEFLWDGSSADGTLAADGAYRFELTATDAAGNSGGANPLPFVVDTRQTPIELAAATSAFSPNNDRVKDSLVFTAAFSFPTEVVNSTLTINRADGTEVRRFTFDGVFDETRWNGLTGAGQVVADGAYSATLAARYTNGNSPRTVVGPIMVDTVFPTVRINADNPIFSPDGDGSRDSVTISHEAASEEEQWVGTITDGDGTVVLQRLWRGRPETITWDGTDSNGNAVPSGTYRYLLVSADAAGNEVRSALDRLVVDTRPTPIRLTIDGTAFSPNGDGSGDTLRFEPILEVSENVDRWEIVINDATDRPVRRLFGFSSVPAEIAFDGRSDDGGLLPQAPYSARLTVVYQAGQSPEATSPTFTIDTTAPTARASVALPVFSPNNDGNRDRVAIAQSGSAEHEWVGSVFDSQGNVVRTVTWPDRPEPTFSWDGRDGAGGMAADGTYTYVVAARDRAGNVGASNRVVFEKDTRPTPISVRIATSAFSPNGDGSVDELRIEPVLSVRDGVESYRLEIIDSAGRAVYQTGSNGAVPTTVVWDGSNTAGRTVADGTYRARLAVSYRNGNQPTAETTPISVDTVFPTVRLASERLIFSADGDGRRDSVSISQTGSDEILWEGSILDASGEVVKGFFWKGRPLPFDWDGTDASANRVADGTYRYAVTATDPAGNSTTRSLGGIRSDTRATPVAINPNRTLFSPNNDGVDDGVSFNLYVGVREGIESWQLTLSTAGRTQRVFEGGASVPASIAWDGAGLTGRAPDGTYVATLSVSYEKGNLATATTASPLVLDTTGPTVGLTVTPIPFSPDDDGIDDFVGVRIRATDVSRIADWHMSILDPAGNEFIAFSGRGAPAAQIIWNGLAADGELVQAAEDYQLDVRVTDVAGNSSRVEEVLPVDILVLRDGDNLRIRISSIQFAPDSPDFLNFDADAAERNMRTLRRLAEILGKYPTYRIVVEGHAASVFWYDQARAAREQRDELLPLATARAEAVKAVLADLGIQAGRMSTVGVGGARPVVPHSDEENRWKNRRVEFLLIRQP